MWGLIVPAGRLWRILVTGYWEPCWHCSRFWGLGCTRSLVINRRCIMPKAYRDCARGLSAAESGHWGYTCDLTMISQPIRQGGPFPVRLQG